MVNKVDAQVKFYSVTSSYNGTTYPVSYLKFCLFLVFITKKNEDFFLPSGDTNVLYMVMGEKLVKEFSNSVEYVELILLEMNMSTGEWRKIKRKILIHG